MVKHLRISTGFCAFVCILGWYDSRLLSWFLLGLVCHELGHVVALHIFRIPIYEVHLRLTGAVIRHGLCSYFQEFICAATGPLANGLLCVFVHRKYPELSMISGLMGLANLLPVFPLDGGRMLRTLLLFRLDEEIVSHVMEHVAVLICCILMGGACCLAVVLQVGVWPIFTALIILWRVGNANRASE